MKKTVEKGLKNAVENLIEDNNEHSISFEILTNDENRYPRCSKKKKKKN